MHAIACKPNAAWSTLLVAGLVWVLGGDVAQTRAADPPVSESVSYLSLETDPENCLSCHRFRGLSRIDEETNELRLFFCSARHYAMREGPHARLRCTACHRREEVSVIPHEVKTPVNCTDVCHLAPATGVEVRFSHRNVLRTLEGSAHSSDMLNSLEFDPPLLRPGQSMCLYCHDQPVFRMPAGAVRPIGQGDATSRCQNCHGPDMPADVAYYTHHVTARMQPTRTMHQLAQICAVCHSDRRIIERMDSHDTVASYLHSFHGKAHLLGSTATATCIDCHASETGNVHAMMAASEPQSSIHPERLPSTCRTAQCHPGAAPGLSQAAVHLVLDPHDRTPEFYVAAFFVLLTACVMTVFFIFVFLELINATVRRTDGHHRKLIHLTRQIKAHPEGRKLLMRLTPHERIQHWVLAITFILLVLTGMPIKFAEAKWASGLIDLFGGLTPARWIHRIAAVIMIAAFIHHIGYLLIAFVRKVREVRKQESRLGMAGVIKMLLNAKPMLAPRDFKEFGQLFAYLVFLRRERPAFRHFNFMQKFEYWAVFWGIPIMGFSGLALWSTASIAEYVSGRALNFAFIIHSDEAYLATIYIAVVHMFSVIFAPSVFPLSPATITGQASNEELVEGHRGSLEAIARQLEIEPGSEPPVDRGVARILKGIVRRLYALSLAGVTAVIGFLSLQFLILLLFTRQTAPVDIVEIPKRIEADALVSQDNAPPGQHADQADRPRSPLAHFHLIPRWFQPDPANSCSSAGCHTPLPHGQRIEVRAFLNMHCTFLDCGVCHLSQPEKDYEARWFSLPGRELQAVPAILRLARILEEQEEIAPDEAAEWNQTFADLLRQAVGEGGFDPQLHEWAAMLETTHPRGTLWQSIVDEMRDQIRFHVHGEYGAKTGLYQSGKLISEPSPAQQSAIRTYREARESLAEGEQKALLAEIHGSLNPTGVLCTPCHSPEPKLVDLDELGYSAARRQSLGNSVIVQQILNIEQGQPFHLPLMLDDPGGTP